MHKKIVYIRGMHCVACEKLLEDELSQVPFVKKVKADRREGQVEIYWNEREPNSSAIVEIIKKFGYEAFENDPSGIRSQAAQKNSLKEWLSAFGITALIFIAYKILLNLGLADLINLKSTDLTYGVAFLVGIAASLSSCLAVVGSVVIAFSEKYKSDNGTLWNGAVSPNLMFHLGRVATFFVLGGLLGMIGGGINISGNAVAIYTIVIAVIMAWLGFSILGIVPSISNIGIALPKRMTSRWEEIKNSNHRSAPLILGGLSFFLPCGFTQSMQIFALASGSFMTGALTLSLFSLGTMPFLLAVGITASWAKTKGRGVFQKVAGMLVVAFAFYTFSSGLAIKGISGNIFSSQQEQPKTTGVKNKNETQANADEQLVEMHVTSRGFEPNVIKVKQGVLVHWVIKGDNITGCTNKIIIPSLDIEKPLKFGDNIVTFTPPKAGDLPFSCWMGMVRGKFVVE